MGVGEDGGAVGDGQGGAAAAAAGVVLGFESGDGCRAAGVSFSLGAACEWGWGGDVLPIVSTIPVNIARGLGGGLDLLVVGAGG